MMKKTMTCGIAGLHGLHYRIGKSTSSLAGAAAQATSDDDSRYSSLVRALNQLGPQSISSNTGTYASLVRWCGDEKALSDGRRVHAHIVACGRNRSTFLANLLVQMYGKCGSVVDGRNVFNEIGQRDMFSWNFMLAAYAQNGHDAEALQLYTHMQMEGVKANKFTFFPILSAIASLRALGEGRQIHESIIACGFESDVAVRTALMNMYGKCGSLKDARTVFDGMQERNVISWTAMIAAYVQNGHGMEALELFRQMDLEGVKPNRITFLSTLDACASLESLENGRAVHKRIAASGHETHMTIRTALVIMYGKCGSLKDAQVVFDKMPERDVILWTAMIAAYVQNDHDKEALVLFKKMDLEGVKPDMITFLNILDACANLASLENGRTIHECIVASGFEGAVAVRTGLVNMYGKCGALKDARGVFDMQYERDLISWNVMIAAYAENGHGKEALQIFRQMDLEGIRPDRITFLSTLDACASLASLENGREIHYRIVASGFELDLTLRNALVNMYGKCGVLKDARTVFDEMHERNVISWTTMIAAYAQNSHGKEALELFSRMDLDGVKPDWVTFVSILNACNHAGLLDVGRQHFVSMCGDYDIAPSEEHYLCMSGLLGRAGCLDEAEDLIINMPVQASGTAWTTLLGACRIHGDVERGARIAEHAFELHPANASPYVLLSNIYAAAARWDDAAMLRKAMKERGLKKKTMCCWIEAKGRIHAFDGRKYPASFIR